MCNCQLLILTDEGENVLLLSTEKHLKTPKDSTKIRHKKTNHPVMAASMPGLSKYTYINLGAQHLSGQEVTFGCKMSLVDTDMYTFILITLW